MKILKYLLLTLVVMSLVCVEVCSMEIVYVNAESGSDMNSGSETAPFATLKAAVASFDGTNGGKIVLSSPQTLLDGEELSCNCNGVVAVTGSELIIEGKLYIDVATDIETVPAEDR